MRKLNAALIVLTLASYSGAPAAFAKSDKKKDEDKTHELVDQIIDAVQDESKRSDEELAELKAKQKERLNRIIDNIAEKTKMSDEEKAKLKEKLSPKKDEATSPHSMPPELKAKLEERFDFKNFSKQTTFQVLTEHLDDSDLKAILKFLKSKTGEKLFQEAPDMLGEVVELSAVRYVPILMDIAHQFKLHDRVAPNFPPLPLPKDNNPEHRREMMEQWQKFLKEHMPQQAPQGPGKDET